MKKIKLTKNKHALVDDNDFYKLNQLKWYAKKDTRTSKFYAARSTVNGTIFMHRIILKTPKNKETDHIDTNGLNNQRKNLRIATRIENGRNRGKNKNNTSGYKGVFKNRGRWSSYIRVDHKLIFLGSFSSKLEAYQAYIKNCKKYHGKFNRSK